jgi:hypothetical protein
VVKTHLDRTKVSSSTLKRTGFPAKIAGKNARFFAQEFGKMTGGY